MATTGAAWEMTSLTTEPIFVALLAAAGTLPMFLFCFFAGILADRFDRRRYIIVCQFWMMGVAAALAVLAFLGQLTHWNLLALSLLHGPGQRHERAGLARRRARDRLRPAAAAGHRAQQRGLQPRPHRRAGDRPDPARPGRRLPALRHQRLHLYRRHLRHASWRRPAEARASQRREGFLEAARTGIAFVRDSGELKAVFARGLCFFVPGIAISTLLPVIGRFELGLDEFSFGVLYAVFGVGAVAGAMLMPTVNRLLGADRANIWAMGMHAAATLVAALAMTPLRRRRLRRRRRRLLDHRDRQQRRRRCR